jgi:hypothetical protein
MREPRCGVTNPAAIVTAARPADRRQVGLRRPAERNGSTGYVKRQF